MSQPENYVRLVIYKRIVEGDLSKFTATSNVTPSGGGARDLRFSPASVFFPVFQRMFPNVGGILRGRFSWKNHADTEAVIRPPSTARPNEIWISTVHKCFPASAIPTDAADCILLIVLDSEGKVCPYFTSERSLTYDRWHPAVKDPVLAGLNARRSARTTPMGYVDIENGVNYTNERV